MEVLGEEVAFKGELAALYDREVAATAARLEELEAQADVLQVRALRMYTRMCSVHAWIEDLLHSRC